MLDLSHPERIAATLDDQAPDLIVNPAAYTAVDQAEEEIDLAYRVNAEAPQAMARWAALQGVPIVHFSTDYVFDGSVTPFRENDTTGPLSVHGRVNSPGGCHSGAGGAF
jgi:dTDP-4-dehydrorhamnose reductase